MTGTNQPEEIAVSNDRALKKLARAITNAQGSFALILVRCNHNRLRDELVDQLKTLCSPLELQELHLAASVKTLYTTIQSELAASNPPSALLVFGLDSVTTVDQVLTSTNQVREEFRKQFQFPLVLWMNDGLLQKWIQLAPDFKSWAAPPIRFETTSHELLRDLEHTITEVFSAILEIGAGRFQGSTNSRLGIASQQFRGLEAAVKELHDRSPTFPARVEAGIQFLKGREADIKGDKPNARLFYEQSLSLWQKQLQATDTIPTDQLQYACVLFHMGLWWRQFAGQHRVNYTEACSNAKDYYQQCLRIFQTADRPELAARFINALGEVLTRLEQWSELESVAQTAVRLHQSHSVSVRLAYGYALQAEVALQRSQWAETKRLAELALHTNDQPLADELEWQSEQQNYRGYYLLLLAQAQRELGQQQAAIAHLETVRTISDPQYDPLLYSRNLDTLRQLYFKQGNYLEAFQRKQEQRSIEQQYGLRAFVGAGRLQSRRQVVNPALSEADQPLSMTQEIAASGRLQDVNRLVARMSRADHKMTVIYGQSGVGKSSLVQAGLVPLLKQQSIEARDVVPVLLQAYNEWEKVLGGSYARSIEEIRGLQLPGLLDSMSTFVAELRQNTDRNLLTVLIFDQFEEFFFAYRDPEQRCPFFEFLRDCLNIPFVKIILSLREDYLHYLLECNRLANLDAIDNNILDKNILYYLGNFSPADAKSVITSLTETSQLYLEADLVDAVVQDLAGELGEVRPIELQVVGAQLQTEKISTLAQFQERGPKEALVGRFLDEVVQDCGQRNESSARIILYLLTDENNTRPLKTQAELAADLALEPEQFSLILNILVKSGLVFLVPGFPAERYQLVHDYLVPFIRQQQSATLVAELEKEREQRKLTEAKLNQALKKQLKTSRRATSTLAALVLGIGGFATVAALAGVNTYITNLSLSSAQKTQLDRMVEALKAGKQQKHWALATIPETQLRVAMDLNQAVYGATEINRLEGHTGAVLDVEFSPSGNLLATASEDKTAKIWSRSGTLLNTLTGHTDKVNHVSFSPDNTMVVTASEDKTAKIWKQDGTLLKTLSGHPGSVTYVSFSPDGTMVATASERTVRVWRLDGKLLKTQLHDGVVTLVQFSPDNQTIASASKDDIVKLWNLNSEEFKTIDNYGALSMRFSFDGKSITLINKDTSVKRWSLDGILLKSTRFSSDDSIIVGSLNADENTIAFTSNFSDKTGISLLSDTGSYQGQISTGHRGLITTLSFSPNGHLLASASQDKTVRIWRLSPASEERQAINSLKLSSDGSTLAVGYGSKIELRNRDHQLNHSLMVDGTNFDLSPDGKHIVAGSTDNTVKVWTLNGEELILEERTGAIRNVSLSPDGDLIASANEDKTVKLWNRSGKLLKVLIGHTQPVENVSFSPDGRVIASVGKDNVIKLWSSDGNPIGTLKGHFRRITEVVFSPDSQTVVSRGDDNLINVWRADGTPVKTLTGHSSIVQQISFSPDSQTIASVAREDNSGEINLWQAQNGSLLTSIDGYGISNLRFTPDGQIIAFSNSLDNTVRLWSIKGTLLVNLKGHNAEVTSLEFSPTEEILATGSADNTIRLWNFSGNLLQTLREHNDRIDSLAFSPNGKNLVSLSSDNLVELRSTEGKEPKTLQPATREEGKSPHYRGEKRGQVKFSPDGSIISLVDKVDEGQNNTVRLWDGKGQALSQVQGSGGESFNVSKDSRTIAISRKDNTLKVWDLNGVFQASLRGHSASVNEFSYSHDGTLIASASNDKTAKLWQTNGELLETFFHAGKVNAVSFSPDNKLIASASDDGTAKLWQKDGKLLATLKHEDKVNAVDFSSDGKSIASASDDRTVKIWDMNGALLQSFKHDDKITKIVFSPDGQLLASAGKDGITKLWSLRDSREVTSIKGNSNSELSLRFSPDGKILAVLDSSSLGVQFYIVDSVWFKNSAFSPRLLLSDLRFTPDGKEMLVSTNNEILFLSLTPDKLLAVGCRWVKDYLASNLNRESDRHLCDGINPP